MTNQEILQYFISQTLLNGLMEVEADDDLLGEDIIDSMGVMQLVAFVEAQFKVTVSQADITITNFRTIETIDAYVTAQHSSSTGA